MLPLEPAYVEDVLNLPEGVCRVRTPATLSAESYEDLADFLELVLRTAKRSVVPRENTNGAVGRHNERTNHAPS